ncbi:RiPP maturation radical SAM C-methyltransferase [Butyrivibrio sp. VCD2006]|uniref:RiPP maturation radical SAM C-methyltransferase n=1 Tax=Butyrivibrio sp. VCD2006 TaxID=1280664 RepID=UPI00042A6531|nr:RiPP maturation radical SAM C-methyltransferase [Butyrivibrio sp. VCD2006]
MVVKDDIKWEIDGKYDVVLLSAPFLYPPQPSFALSLFKERLSGSGISSKVIYPMFFMSHVLGKEISMESAIYPGIVGIPEFCFAHLTDVEFNYSVNDYIKGLIIEELLEDKKGFREFIHTVRDAAELCVEVTAQMIISLGAKVLAGSSIYSQQNATFAIFKRVKELDPSIKTIMGGTNLRDQAGAAVLRHYKSVDYVFFGDGDEVFDVVCQKLIDGDETDMPYGVVRYGTELGSVVPARVTKDMNKVPYPDYSDFIEEWDRERSGYYGKSILVKENGEPLMEGDYVIYVEGSRGCWWGEKHCCTFCGLNGDKNIYRAKSPERLYEELKELNARYPGKYIQLTDNIMSMEVLHELIPKMAKNKEKYKLIGEIKTNIKEEDIKRLAEAGFVKMQPGIESLNDHMLKLLGKGNTAVNHIAFLKYARYHGLELAWNILDAIPGETDEDYYELYELLPKLYHFKHPLGPYSILFQKFSKYDEDPAAYGLELTPYRAYRYMFGDDPDRYNNMILYYELTGGSFKEEKARRKELYEKLDEMVETWKRLDELPDFHGLTMDDDGEGIFIMDTRPCSKSPFTMLTGIQSEIYRLAWGPVSYKKICEELGDKYSEDEIKEALNILTDSNLMLYLSDRYLALALPSGKKEEN